MSSTAIYYDWFNGSEGAGSPELISDKEYPMVFAWAPRFERAVNAAEASATKPNTLNGDGMLERVIVTNLVDVGVGMDNADALQLHKDQR
jgi:hypothetical protein